MKKVLPKIGLSAIENQRFIDILSVDEYQLFQLVTSISFFRLFLFHLQISKKRKADSTGSTIRPVGQLSLTRYSSALAQQPAQYAT